MEPAAAAGSVAAGKLFTDFASFLKKKTDTSSVKVATRTVELLREVATLRRWNTARFGGPFFISIFIFAIRQVS